MPLSLSHGSQLSLFFYFSFISFVTKHNFKLWSSKSEKHFCPRRMRALKNDKISQSFNSFISSSSFFFSFTFSPIFSFLFYLKPMLFPSTLTFSHSISFLLGLSLFLSVFFLSLSLFNSSFFPIANCSSLLFWFFCFCSA